MEEENKQEIKVITRVTEKVAKNFKLEYQIEKKDEIRRIARIKISNVLDIFR
jgi:hypothetical protein